MPYIVFKAAGDSVSVTEPCEDIEKACEGIDNPAGLPDKVALLNAATDWAASDPPVGAYLLLCQYAIVRVALIGDEITCPYCRATQTGPFPPDGDRFHFADGRNRPPKLPFGVQMTLNCQNCGKPWIDHYTHRSRLTLDQPNRGD